MMDRLEKSSGQTVITLAEAKSLLKLDDDFIVAVYDYWLNKRLKMVHYKKKSSFSELVFISNLFNSSVHLFHKLRVKNLVEPALVAILTLLSDGEQKKCRLENTGRTMRRLMKRC